MPEDEGSIVRRLTGGPDLGRGVTDWQEKLEGLAGQWSARAKLLGEASHTAAKALPPGHPVRLALFEALMRAGYPGSAAELAHERSYVVPDG